MVILVLIIFLMVGLTYLKYKSAKISKVQKLDSSQFGGVEPIAPSPPKGPSNKIIFNEEDVPVPKPAQNNPDSEYMEFYRKMQEQQNQSLNNMLN